MAGLQSVFKHVHLQYEGIEGYITMISREKIGFFLVEKLKAMSLNAFHAGRLYQSDETSHHDTLKLISGLDAPQQILNLFRRLVRKCQFSHRNRYLIMDEILHCSWDFIVIV